MAKLLETSKLLKELNALWDEHGKHVSNTNTQLKELLATVSNLPSKYLTVIKNINTAQNALTASTRKLNTVTLKQTKEIENLLIKKRALLSNSKALAKAVGALEAKLAKATAELVALRSASTTASTGMTGLNNRLTATQARVTTLTARVAASNRVIRSFGTAMMFSFRTLTNLMSAFGVMTGVFLFAAVTKSIFDEVRALESLNLAFRNVSETQSNFLTQQSFIAAMSEKYGLQFKNLTKQYTQWYVSAKEKLGETEIQQIFESIANAGANMGLTIEAQNSVFLALEQMMSKGTVQAEELKRQLGNSLPGAFEIMVKTIQKLNPEIKVTQKTVLEMMREGKIMSADVLPEFAKQMELAYGISTREKVTTLNAEVNRMSNSWTNFVNDMNGSKNVIGKFFEWFITSTTEAIEFWGDLLESSENKRRKFLEGLQIGGSNLAKTNLDIISGDADKVQYAADRIAELSAEYDALKIARDGLIKTSGNERDNLSRSLAGGARGVRNEYEAAENARLIVEQEERLSVITGLIDGYKSLKILEDGTVDDDDAGARGRRERVALTFDWIKAEYALKKAIIERLRAEQAHDMNDETKTLAQRLESRSSYSELTLKLINLEHEEERALNVVKYTEDLARNKTAYKNKDLTLTQYNQNIADLNKRLNFEQLKSDEDYSAKFQKLVYENTEFSMRMYEKKLEYSRRLTKAEVDFYILQNQEILDRKNVTDNEMIKSSQAIRDAEYDQAVKARDEALRLAYDEAVLKAAIWAEFGTNVYNINKKLNTSLEAMAERRAKRDAEIADLRREAYGYQPVIGYRKEGFLDGADSEMKAKFEELVKNYIIAVEEGDETILAERKRQLDDFKNYITSINDYARDFFTKFASNSGMETLLDVLGKKVEGFGENWKTTLLAVSQIAQETFELMNQNSSDFFDADRERLERAYDYNIEMAGENKAAKTAIDKQYEREKREINRKEAKAKQESALFNIAIDTAQAILGLWVNPGFPAAVPLAIAVGALGAFNASQVASRQLPQFWVGTNNAPEGFAYTDEKGAELHLDRYNRIKDYGSDSGARIKKLSQGDKIIPADRTKSILSGINTESLDDILFKNNITYSNNNNNQLDASGIISSINSLKHSVENKESSEEVYDVRGYTKFKRVNGSRIEEKNNRIRFKK